MVVQRNHPLSNVTSASQLNTKKPKVKIFKIRRKHPVDSNKRRFVEIAWKNSAPGRATSSFRKGSFAEGLRTINKYVKPEVALTYFDFWNTIIQKEADNEMLMLSVDVNSTVFLSNGPPAPLPSLSPK
jgi:hypothetical protein